MIRSHAAWALGRIRDDGAGRVLEDAYQTERETEVRQEIETALDGG
jgi:hypothetical protein